MRILAIRGCNLASLLEIDLSRGPIGAAAVFAIVGPTGAGGACMRSHAHRVGVAVGGVVPS